MKMTLLWSFWLWQSRLLLKTSIPDPQMMEGLLGSGGALSRLLFFPGDSIDSAMNLFNDRGNGHVLQ